MTASLKKEALALPTRSVRAADIRGFATTSTANQEATDPKSLTAGFKRVIGEILKFAHSSTSGMGTADDAGGTPSCRQLNRFDE